jgi:hypothetical protein
MANTANERGSKLAHRLNNELNSNHMQLATDTGQGCEPHRQRRQRFGRRICRREFLTLTLAASAVCASSSARISIRLLPLYNSKYAPVGRESIDAVTAALEKTYSIKVLVCKPELIDITNDANLVLDWLSQQAGRVMGVMSGPLRAPVRTGIGMTVMSVLGWADVPSDDRERPRGSLITTSGLENLRERDMIETLGVVAIHELGHNLGAWDCRNGACYMNGRIDLRRSITPTAFCSEHKELLWSYLRGSS